MNHPHIPILLTEILSLLSIKANDTIIDATVGYGGHSQAFLNRLSEKGFLFGIDRDIEAIEYSKTRFKNHQNKSLIQAKYSEISSLISNKKIQPATILFVDLGISSYQIDTPKRGFSFLEKNPLDMRMNQKQDKITAQHILETACKDTLHQMFYNYAEIKKPDRLVQTIINYRKTNRFNQSEDLKNCIKKSFYFNNNRNRFLKCCAQVFQALRIEVNQELEELNILLNNCSKILKPNAKVAFLSFHSLEDRMIKHYFKKKPSFKAINKKVIQASQEEIRKNSRSKSAKLRVYQYQKTNDEIDHSKN